MKTLARIGAIFAVMCVLALSTDEAEAGYRRRVIVTPDGRTYVVVIPDQTTNRLQGIPLGPQPKRYNPATTLQDASPTMHWRWRKP